MAQKLSNTSAWINGQLGIGTDEPFAQLEVIAADTNELARFSRENDGGLKIFAEQQTLIVQGFTATGSPSPLTLNSAGGDLALGSHSSRVAIPGSLSVSEGLVIGDTPVIDSAGKWVGDPTGLRGEPGTPGTSSWIDGAGKVTTEQVNVGIGTTSPQSTLDIRGDVRLRQLSFNLPSGEDSFAGAGLWVKNNIEGEQADWLQIGGVATDKQRLSIAADITHVSGRLGIGIATPKGALHVQNDATYLRELYLTDPRGEAFPNAMFAPVEFPRGEAVWLKVGGIRFGDTTSRLLLDGDKTYLPGNVGIGTAEPDAYKLKVEGGDVYVGGSLVVTGTIQGQLCTKFVREEQVVIPPYDNSPGTITVELEVTEEPRFYLISGRVINPGPSQRSSIPPKHVSGVLMGGRQEPWVTWRHQAYLRATHFIPASGFDPNAPIPQPIDVMQWQHEHQIRFENQSVYPVEVAYKVYRIDLA